MHLSCGKSDFFSYTGSADLASMSPAGCASSRPGWEAAAEEAGWAAAEEEAGSEAAAEEAGCTGGGSQYSCGASSKPSSGSTLTGVKLTLPENFRCGQTFGTGGGNGGGGGDNGGDGGDEGGINNRLQRARLIALVWGVHGVIRGDCADTWVVVIGLQLAQGRLIGMATDLSVCRWRTGTKPVVVARTGPTGQVGGSGSCGCSGGVPAAAVEGGLLETLLILGGCRCGS